MKGQFYSYLGIKNKFVKENTHTKKKRKMREEMVTSFKQKTKIARASRVWPHTCHEPCSDPLETSFRKKFCVEVKNKILNYVRFKLGALKENATKIKYTSTSRCNGIFLLTN